jgi:hypothetical protein
MLGRHEVTNKAYEPRHAVTDPTPENTPLLSRVGLKAGGLVLEYLVMIQEGQQAWDKMYNATLNLLAQHTLSLVRLLLSLQVAY